jgi:outer membrane protein assembly factor BamB
MLAISTVIVIVVAFTIVYIPSGKETDGTGSYAPWPMMGGDPQHTGVSKYDAPKSPVHLEWELQIEGECGYPVITSDNRIIFSERTFPSDDEGYLVCADDNGSVLWKIVHDPLYGFNSPTVGPDNLIYTGEINGNVLCYFPDGGLNWSKKMGFEPFLTISNSNIYVASEGKLSALKLNGSLDWEYVLGPYGDPDCFPTVDKQGTIYVLYHFMGEQAVEKVIEAINPNGTLKWRTETAQPSYFVGMRYPPIIGPDGTVYVGTDDRDLLAFAPNGTKKWGFSLNGEMFGAAVSKEGTVYAAAIADYQNKSHVYAINPDGSLKWSFESIANGSYVTTPMISSDGIVFFGCNDRLYAVDSEGVVKWFYEAIGIVYSPMIGENGILYFVSTELKVHEYTSWLYALDSSH